MRTDKNLQKILEERERLEREFAEQVSSLLAEDVWVERADENLKRLKRMFPNKEIPPSGHRCEICERVVDNPRLWRINLFYSSDVTLTCRSCAFVGKAESSTLKEFIEKVVPTPVRVKVNERAFLELLEEHRISMRVISTLSEIPYSSFRNKLKGAGFTIEEMQRITGTLFMLGSLTGEQ